MVKTTGKKYWNYKHKKVGIDIINDFLLLYNKINYLIIY